jgi:peptide chain release factor 3
MQLFYIEAHRREPIVGVVGALQLDVITSRLRTEYGVDAQLDTASYAAARWVADPEIRIPPLGGGAAVALDRLERRVILFASEWEVQYFERQHPSIRLLAESPT